MTRWQALFEKVIVPSVGLGLVIYAALGGSVPVALYPVLAGMIGYPGVKALDRARKMQANGG